MLYISFSLSYLKKSKMPKWSLSLSHFNPKMKLFVSGSLGFHFCCHFHPIGKLG
ncbi:hypothetical protein Hanom_Chr07g00615991 [Helianthus anomalus]